MSLPPPSERPRERCLEQGAGCLSLRECLALVIGSGPPGRGCLGLATSILERPGPGMGPQDEERAFFTAMEITALAHLKAITGLGPAGQARLLAAFEMGRRYALFRESARTRRRSPSKLPGLARSALGQVSQARRNEPREWLGFVPLYRSGNLGELCIVERGVRTHVNVDPAELFARLLALRPQAFFLFHNHPSGDTTPSEPDYDLTYRVDAISRQLGVRLLGHWIVAARAERWLAPEGVDCDMTRGWNPRPRPLAPAASSRPSSASAPASSR